MNKIHFLAGRARAMTSKAFLFDPSADSVRAQLPCEAIAMDGGDYSSVNALLNQIFVNICHA
jgi:hypothetical protein